MAAGDFTKFNSFITEVAAGTHVNVLNASTDTVKAALTNTTPLATNTVLANIAQITDYTDISETWPIDVSNTTSQSATTITVGVAATVVATATAAVDEFQFVVLYNDTATNDELIGWYDNGSKVNLTNGQTFTVTFGSELFTLG